ncbi:hypothetical protein AC249_AIPGENE21509 [Exaiptasia diaphana]|nr:hypothetical protein AC249_AIPGENE21509 [Exaiptasia diaphana]
MENENLRQLYLSRGARKGVLTRKINRINEIIQLEPSQEDFVTLETLEREYDNAFRMFKEEHEKLQCQLVDPSAIDESFKYFDEVLLKYYASKRRIDAWKADLIDTKDSVSSASSKSRSSTSSRKSTASINRCKSAAKLAALQVEAASLNKKYQLAEEKLRLKQREDRLKLETKLKKVRAKEKVYQQFDFDEQGVQESTSIGQQIVENEYSTRDELNSRLFDESLPHTFTPVPCPQEIPPMETTELNMDQNDYKITPRLHDVKPKQEVCKSTLKKTKQSDQNDSNERLQLLIQYCTGKAKNIVKGCGMMDADEGYKTAKALLERRFGDKYVVSDAWIKKLQTVHLSA